MRLALLAVVGGALFGDQIVEHQITQKLHYRQRLIDLRKCDLVEVEIEESHVLGLASSNLKYKATLNPEDIKVFCETVVSKRER